MFQEKASHTKVMCMAAETPIMHDKPETQTQTSSSTASLFQGFCVEPFPGNERHDNAAKADKRNCDRKGNFDTCHVRRHNGRYLVGRKSMADLCCTRTLHLLRV